MIPLNHYFLNSDRTVQTGQRITQSSFPFSAPCDNVDAFDGCGCRTPYEGFNLATQKCQRGEISDSRDQTHCADNDIAYTGPIGCFKDRVSLEAWFPDPGMEANCVRIKQAVVRSYRGEKVRIERRNGETGTWENVMGEGRVAEFGSGQSNLGEVVSFKEKCGNYELAQNLPVQCFFECCCFEYSRYMQEIRFRFFLARCERGSSDRSTRLHRYHSCRPLRSKWRASRTRCEHPLYRKHRIGGCHRHLHLRSLEYTGRHRARLYGSPKRSQRF